MIGKVIHTFGSKILIAFISFILLLLHTNYLGPAGIGTIGLIVLNITIIQLVSNLINGSIVYYSSRLPGLSILITAYIWSGLTLPLFYIINQVVPIFGEEYAFNIYLLGLLQSIFSIHLFLLLGYERIKVFNLLSLLQSLLTLISVMVFYVGLRETVVKAYLISLYVSYGSVLLLSIVYLFPYLRKSTSGNIKDAFKKLFSYGIYIQAANTFQLLNYRISYFILDAFSGRAALGLYTAGIQLSEAMLIPGRSIATVQYARISAKQNDTYAQRITILFMKLSFIITLISLLIVFLTPASVFSALLGEEFGLVKTIISYMSLGLICLSAEIILSHYFSGTGRQQINTLSAAIGLGLTLLFNFMLIPEFGALGAAMATALSYSGMFLFLFLKMHQQQGISRWFFIPNRRDWELLQRLRKQKNG